MARKNFSSKKLILSTLGMVVAVPLIAAPASAALGGGNFHIHAKNTDTGQESFAGFGVKRDGSAPGGSGGGGTGAGGDGTGGDGTNPGGGTGGDGTNPGGGTPGTGGGTPGGGGIGDVDNSTVLTAYKCGPISFNLTQAMVDHSNANRALQNAGRGSETTANSDGMKEMIHSADGLNSAPGYPASGTPIVLQLNSEMDLPLSLSTGPTLKVLAIDYETFGAGAGTCGLYNFTKAPKAGESYGFVNNGSSIAENRYMNGDSGLNSTTVQEAPTATVVLRTLVGNDTQYAKSDSVPSYLVSYKGDNWEKLKTKVQMNYTAPRNGYDRLDYLVKLDGSTQIEYRSGEALVDRQQGPNTVVLNDQGAITSVDGVATSSAAEYNARTGKSWDGKLPKLSDFDASIPFKPSDSL